MRFAYLCLEKMILIGSLALGITACSNNETEEEPAATPEVAIAEEVTEEAEAEADPETFPDIVAIVNGVEIPKTELLERITGAEAQMGRPSDPKTVAFYHGGPRPNGRRAASLSGEPRSRHAREKR